MHQYIDTLRGGMNYTTTGIDGGFTLLKLKFLVYVNKLLGECRTLCGEHGSSLSGRRFPFLVDVTQA